MSGRRPTRWLVPAGIAIEGWPCYTLGMAKKREATRKPGRAASGKATVPAVSEAIDSRVDVLYRQVREIIEQARATAARSVNTAMVRAYWLVGREVVEEEQKGSARAGYGDELIDRLSARLRAEFGRGYNPSNLPATCGLFYLAYPNCSPARFITRCVTNRG